jgi:hypothetical protein
MSNQTGPGLARQSSARTLLRVAGPVLLVVGLGFVVTAFVDFFGSTGSFGGPDKFWMFFVGLPLLFVGGGLTQAGYVGTAARYVAGETMPVVKDSATYLSDGRGVAGVGRTEEAAAATGPYCRECGTRNDADARFCDSCGQSLA